MLPPFTRTETAPLLRVFGEHAARIATMVRLRPTLLTRLAFAPAPAIHAVGAWLYLAAEADQPDDRLAALLDEIDPRELLRTAVPEAPPRLYKAMGRIGDRVREKRFYERLAAICATPAVDVLWGEHPITDSLLDFAECLVRLDPLVLRFRPILSRSVSNAERLDVIIRLLRAHHALVEDDLVLPAQTGLAGLCKRLQEAFERIEAPHPGFELQPPLHVIRTVGELRDVGKELRNCLSNLGADDHSMKLIDGSSVLVSCGDPPFIASLVRAAPGLWTFSQMAGPTNEMLSLATVDGFERELVKAGVALLPHSPRWSLDWLSHPGSGSGRRRLPPDPDGNRDADAAA